MFEHKQILLLWKSADRKFPSRQGTQAFPSEQHILSAKRVSGKTLLCILRWRAALQILTFYSVWMETERLGGVQLTDKSWSKLLFFNPLFLF